MQTPLPAAILFWMKGGCQPTAGMLAQQGQTTGTDTLYAASSPFFPLECLHDAQSRKPSPESVVILNQCQQPSRSRLPGGEKKIPLLAGLSYSQNLSTGHAILTLTIT